LPQPATSPITPSKKGNTPDTHQWGKSKVSTNRSRKRNHRQAESNCCIIPIIIIKIYGSFNAWVRCTAYKKK
jgi:hypothetical protein